MRKDGRCGQDSRSEPAVLWRRLLAEFLGSGFLAAVVIGSGISSTSFANPAITIGRMFSDSFAGIAPSLVPPYIAAGVAGGIAGVLIIKALYLGVTPAEAADVVVPHEAAAAAAAVSDRPTPAAQEPARTGH